MERERGKLKHLLILLLEALSANPEAGASHLSRLQEKADAAGLHEDDVHDLLDWIENNLLPDQRHDWPDYAQPEAPSLGSFRHFGDMEKEYLTPAGMGLLLELFNSGQVDRVQLESLLQYSSQLAYRPLTPYDLEPVLEQVLFRPGRPGLTGGAADGFDNIH
jgi:uncharacterized protein Smg (DUF494 family)